MPLSPDQQAASDQFMDFLLDDDETEIAISGPGGTGKSFLTKHLIKAAYKQIKMLEFLTEDDHSLSIHLTATTNKAAKVLSELTDNGEATTIHSLLGLKVENDYKTGKVILKRTKNSTTIYNSIIFVDEGSMVNTQLLKIIRCLTVNCKVVYIGDDYQLAPVGENVCPVFTQVKSQIKLTTIQRQVADSPIIQLGTAYRDALDCGTFPKLESMDDVIQVVSGPEFKEHVEEYFDINSPIDSKMIAWTNDRVHQYNDFIRKMYTPQEAYEIGELVVTNKPILMPNGAPYATTESVLQVSDVTEGVHENIKGWFINFGNEAISAFQPRSQLEVKNLLKQYAREKNWYQYFAAKDFFADLRPVHACTTHKSQGSTYNTSFIDVGDIGRNGKKDEVARMMYVAVTRASDRIYINGDLQAKFY